MKELIILRGIPGSGKSSFAELLKPMGAFIIAADDFHMVDGVYDWKPERVKWCHTLCRNTVEAEMHSSNPMIVVHNTFTTEKEMKPYFELATRYGYLVRSLVVENRHGNKNIHNVPDSTLDAMIGRFSVKLK